MIGAFSEAANIIAGNQPDWKQSELSDLQDIPQQSDHSAPPETVQKPEDVDWMPNSVFESDGTEYKTDDYGHIYQIDGAYCPDDFFVIDGQLYMTDEKGALTSEASSAEPDEDKGDCSNSDNNKDVNDAAPIQNKIDGLAREENVSRKRRLLHYQRSTSA